MTTSFLSIKSWPDADLRVFGPILMRAAIKEPGSFIRSDKGRLRFPEFPKEDHELIPDFFRCAGFSDDDALRLAFSVSDKPIPQIKEPPQYRPRPRKKGTRVMFSRFR